MTWGWRIPFLVSVILIGISMYIELNLEDTKAFRELENSSKEKQATETMELPVPKCHEMTC